VFDEFSDSAFVVKLVRTLRLFSLIFNRDADAFVEKGLLTQSFRELVEAELSVIKNLGIRLESDLGSALAGLTGLLQTGHRDSSNVVLLVSFAVSPNLKMQCLRKKVNAGDTHTVESAGNLVSI
jgi:hypothetical protein